MCPGYEESGRRVVQGSEEVARLTPPTLACPSGDNSSTPHGRLMLTVLGGLAEFDRELIRARTGEGRKRAKERGVRFGRPRKMTPHQRQEALQRHVAGEMSLALTMSMPRRLGG
jgi:DNA invertase Pin-like site-specific DNA recombinase